MKQNSVYFDTTKDNDLEHLAQFVTSLRFYGAKFEVTRDAHYYVVEIL